DVERVFWWRDQVVDGWEDSGHDTWLAERQGGLVRGGAPGAAPRAVAGGGGPLGGDAPGIATGAPPAPPAPPRVGTAARRATHRATSAREVPRSLLVLGGGAAGCELAQLYRRLGTEVTISQRGPRLMPRIDSDAAGLVEQTFLEEGISLHLGVAAERVQGVG